MRGNLKFKWQNSETIIEIKAKLELVGRKIKIMENKIN